MRIMLVISSLRRGGAERVFSIMANYWAERGHVVALTTLSGLEGDSYQLHPGVNRIALECAPKSRDFTHKIFNNLRRIRRLRSVNKRWQPDVVISCKTETNLLALLALCWTSIAVTVYEVTDPSQLPTGVFRSRLRHWLYPRAAAVVVQTDQVRTGMQRFLPGTEITVIPNPVPAADPDWEYEHVALRQQLDLPANARVLSAMGRLGPEKGFDLLTEAFSRVQANYPEWHLVIFGEGVERPMLEGLIARLDLRGRVHLPGQVHTARKCLMETDLFVLSSRFEGFPNALLEAMACGLPVISFDCPSGPAEIIRSGLDGTLVKPQDVQELAVALSDLMGDESRRARFGQEAREVVRRFSLGGVMDKWDRLLNAVASQPAAATPAKE